MNGKLTKEEQKQIEINRDTVYEIECTPDMSRDELIQAYQEQCIFVGRRRGPVDIEMLEDAITVLYKALGYERPEFVRCTSPQDAQKKMNKHQGTTNHVYTTFLYGSLDSYWIWYYLLCNKLGEQYTDEQMRLLKAWETISWHAFFWWPFDDICFFCDRPDALYIDENDRLSNDQGAALSFSDGWKIYAINNIEIDGWIIEEPWKLTPKHIRDEPNSEVRRLMIELYGWDKWFKDVNAKVVDEHPNPQIGTLWLYTDPVDSIDVYMLQFENGTAELDGTYKKYALRIDPRIIQQTEKLQQGDLAYAANKSTYPALTDEEFADMILART